jgi:signal transduction histidine kinase
MARAAHNISHDLRSVVNVVRGSADLARMKLEPDHPAAVDIARINRACEELAALTMELRAMCVSTVTPPTSAPAEAPAPLQ